MSRSIALLRRAEAVLQNKDDRRLTEANLLDFAEYVWPVVEPAIPFVKGWALEAISEHLQAVTDGYIRRLLINVPPGFTKSLMTDVFWPAWEWGPRNMPWLRYMCAAYSNHLTERDNMRCRNIVISDRYKRLWGNRFGISNEQFTKIKFANDRTGWKLATSVAGIGTGERADRCILDDPNNPMEMESEAVRNTTNMWFTEVMPDRLNNQAESAIIVIQQRTHEDDVSGTAISRNMGYTHLNIRMRHEPRVYVNGFDEAGQIRTYLDDDVASIPPEKVFWKDHRDDDGELAWPERFSEKICDELERDKGPYAWCSTAEAPVLMANLSMKRIDEIIVGDKIVGFKTAEQRGDGKRARLEPAEVLSISRSRQSVVKITLDSGYVVRCTPDHKWWTGRFDRTHPAYAPAYAPGQNKKGKKGRGSALFRVCPPKLPELLHPEDQRLAGWLSGFFDGEGSTSLLRRREGSESLLITFSQTAEKNKPICDKLENALDYFGFSYAYKERQANDLSGAAARRQKTRLYYLTSGKKSRQRGSRFSLNQQFLHIVQPVKWRERIINTSVNGRLFTSEERVVSIEPDGEEIVYGLHTTTGNYVVWGLASSNSGQYQQSPEPRGGSIIKRDWWQVWEGDKFPDFDYILGVLDTAYTEKQENDPSAMVILGVFRERLTIDVETEALWMPRDGQTAKQAEGNPKIMLMYAWRERLEFYDLIQKVIDTCIITPVPKPHPRYPIDRLIIEGKATGHSVRQELYRLLGATGKFGIETVDYARGRWTPDKVARLHSVQHLFSNNMVYAPDRAWADMVIDEVSVFPRGSHDDLVDCISMGLRYLRDTGFALRSEESELARRKELMYSGNSGNSPLYQV